MNFNISYLQEAYTDRNQIPISLTYIMMGFYVVKRVLPDDKLYETAEAGLKLTKSGVEQKQKTNSKTSVVTNYEVPIYKKDDPVQFSITMLKTKYDEKQSKKKPITRRVNKTTGKESEVVPKKKEIKAEDVTIEGVEHKIVTYETKRSKFIPTLIKDVKNIWLILAAYFANDIIRFYKADAIIEDLITANGTISKMIYEVSKGYNNRYYDEIIFDSYQTEIAQKYSNIELDCNKLLTGEIDKICKKFITDPNHNFRIGTIFTRYFNVTVTQMLANRCINGSSLDVKSIICLLYGQYVTTIKDNEFDFHTMKDAMLSISSKICEATRKTPNKKTGGRTEIGNIGNMTTTTETYDDNLDSDNLKIDGI